MNRGLLLLCLFALTTFGSISAQEHQHGPWCVTDEYKRDMMGKFPELVKAEKDYQKRIQSSLLQKDDEDELYIIPIVFHILHDNGPENISDEQIFSAVEMLNEQYRKLGADTVEVIPEFRDIHADTRIEFRLANKAPDGSCTNGIDRIPTVLTYNADDNSKIGQWPRHVYFNIWVVNNIERDTPGLGLTLGYGTFPFMVDDPALAFLDGIVVRSDAIGRTGTANPDWYETLAHECGHNLNQRHVWGDFGPVGTTCGDDGIEDTPETKGWPFCPSPDEADECNPGVIENYQNFMEYSFCAHMFTEDQKASMRATLADDAAGRSFLSTPSAHAIAGIDQEDPTICSPEVNFRSNRYYTCVGNNIQFNSVISRATAESFAWTFEDASVGTSNDVNPIVSFNSPGWKTVSLTAGNESGSGTKTDEFAIYVYAQEPENIGDELQETFWSGTDVNDGWTVGPANENVSVEGVNWAWSPIGALDQGSLKLNLFDSPSRELYRFVSPRFDLSEKEGQIISFKYAYATQANPEDMDVNFSVTSSTNCGNVNTQRFSITEPAELLTAGSFPGVSFEPTDISMWRTAQIPITSALAVDGIQFEFRLRADAGANNFYFDNFTIGSSLVSVENENPLTETKLFPNPANDFAQLELILNEPQVVSVSIFDITGKQVQSVQGQIMGSGVNNLRLETSSLAAGIYTVKVIAGDFDRSLKLMIRP